MPRGRKPKLKGQEKAPSDAFLWQPFELSNAELRAAGIVICGLAIDAKLDPVELEDLLCALSIKEAPPEEVIEPQVGHNCLARHHTRCHVAKCDCSCHVQGSKPPYVVTSSTS